MYTEQTRSSSFPFLSPPIGTSAPPHLRRHSLLPGTRAPWAYPPGPICPGQLRGWVQWQQRQERGARDQPRGRGREILRTTTKCRMGGSAQKRLPGAWAGTGAPRRIFGWGTLPLRCLIGVGVAACSVCLSVCFRSRVVVGVWLACHPASGLRSANH